MNPKHLKTLILLLTFIAIVTMSFAAPMAQDVRYHDFADQRTIISIPNFWNVVTNLGFLYVGVLGLYRLHVARNLTTMREMQLGYTVFLFGVALVAFGSGFYHWHPDNDSLIWDRLPMTIAFMGLLAVVLSEFLSVAWGTRALKPMLLLGASSALYWYWGERHGQGDLRLYVLVQFFPILLMLVLFVLGKNVFDTLAGYKGLLVFYLLAKFTEEFDHQIFAWTGGLISGHSLKHLLAAVGVYVLLACFGQRRLNIFR